MSDRERIVQKMIQVERLFEREPSSWRRVQVGEHVAEVACGLFYKEITARRVCIKKPPEPIPMVRLDRSVGARESMEHAVAKWLLAEHMRANGSLDPVFEYSRDGFRHDVYCPQQDWAGECGNTTVSWLGERIDKKEPLRLTLVPFQRGLTEMVRDFHRERPVVWRNVWGVEFRSV